MSEEDVPPQTLKTFALFKFNSHDLVYTFVNICCKKLKEGRAGWAFFNLLLWYKA